jgi:hypothetical protein
MLCCDVFSEASEYDYVVGFDILMMVSINMAVSLLVVPCSLV